MSTQPVRNEKGEWVIPATRRPDGTWRKERVLKEGYVPQDEVAVYENRNVARAKTRGIPGMNPNVLVGPNKGKNTCDKGRGEINNTPRSQPNNKSEASTAQQEQKQKTTEESKAEEIVSAVEAIQLSTANEEVATQDAKAKKLKALRKKLREIEEILKKDPNQISKEQKEKADKKTQIESEIQQLETELATNSK